MCCHVVLEACCEAAGFAAHSYGAAHVHGCRVYNPSRLVWIGTHRRPVNRHRDPRESSLHPDRYDTSLTSKAIDQLVDLFMRDFVVSWYGSSVPNT